MTTRLAEYAEAAGSEVVEQLQKLAKPLKGKTVVHVNSTRLGGGVAEILMWLIALMEDLGLKPGPPVRVNEICVEKRGERFPVFGDQCGSESFP